MPSTSQGAYSNPADELQEPLDELDGLGQARNMMRPSTSTPNNHVQPLLFIIFNPVLAPGSRPLWPAISLLTGARATARMIPTWLMRATM